MIAMAKANQKRSSSIDVVRFAACGSVPGALPHEECLVAVVLP
jgi:hypothetical protein